MLRTFEWRKKYHWTQLVWLPILGFRNDCFAPDYWGLMNISILYIVYRIQTWTVKISKHLHTTYIFLQMMGLRRSCVIFTLISVLGTLPSIRAGLLYPRESESRSIRLLDGIWNFRVADTNDPTIGQREKWFEKELKKVSRVKFIQ